MGKQNVFVTKQLIQDMAEDRKFQTEVINAVMRFMDNDWGDLCEEDKELNVEALKDGGRILAAYETSNGKVYIITDDTAATPQVTTVLYASEY
jgi:hypothetical protein